MVLPASVSVATLSWIAVAPFITVQFDGSLRHLRDPGSSDDSQVHAARYVCGAATSIRIHGEDALGREDMILLGGKKIDSSAVSNSAEVEYEGIIFALDCLQSYLDSVPCRLVVDPNHSRRIVVQGDCKTVIEQMKGKARPRKLEPYYRRGQSYVRNLNRNIPGGVHFHHIPRCHNNLCDRISARVVAAIQDEAMDALLRAMDSLRNNIWQDHRMNTQSSGGTGTAVSDFLREHFTVATMSWIPPSKRGYFYQCLMEITVQMQDYKSLLTIADMFKAELDRILDHHKKVPYSDPTSVRLRLWTLVCQIVSLELLGRTKESVSYQHKNRYTLNQHPVEVRQLDEAIRTGNSLPWPLSHHLIRPPFADPDVPWPREVEDWYQAAARSETWCKAGWFVGASSMPLDPLL